MQKSFFTFLEKLVAHFFSQGKRTMRSFCTVHHVGCRKVGRSIEESLIESLSLLN